MTKVVGNVDMDAVKFRANNKIDTLLKDAWLDPDTVRDFKYQQRKLQVNAFRLVALAGQIELEISQRKKVYGT